jgi:hypothetical protein
MTSFPIEIIPKRVPEAGLPMQSKNPRSDERVRISDKEPQAIEELHHVREHGPALDDNNVFIRGRTFHSEFGGL